LALKFYYVKTEKKYPKKKNPALFRTGFVIFNTFFNPILTNY